MADAAVDPKDGAELVFVPGGAFQFGLTDAQVASVPERFPGTSPGYLDLMRAGRSVILSDYWIYRHPVTVGQ